MKLIRRHTWLFSFVDIAFLLLLVYTQLARMNTNDVPVAEMRLPAPVVVSNPELTAMKAEKDYYQLLVEKHSAKPYRLARIIGGNESTHSDSMDSAALVVALNAVLNERKGEPRPVVVPLPESYSSDLLQGAAIVGKLWNQAGRAVVHTAKGDVKS